MKDFFLRKLYAVQKPTEKYNLAEHYYFYLQNPKLDPEQFHLCRLIETEEDIRNANKRAGREIFCISKAQFHKLQKMTLTNLDQKDEEKSDEKIDKQAKKLARNITSDPKAFVTYMVEHMVEIVPYNSPFSARDVKAEPRSLKEIDVSVIENAQRQIDNRDLIRGMAVCIETWCALYENVIILRDWVFNGVGLEEDVETYLTKIAKKLEMDQWELVAAFHYLMLFLHAAPEPPFIGESINEFNVKRLMLVSCLMGQKFWHDKSFNNAAFAFVGDEQLTILNELERVFLQKIQYNLILTENQFKGYAEKLKAIEFPEQAPKIPFITMPEVVSKPDEKDSKDHKSLPVNATYTRVRYDEKELKKIRNRIKIGDRIELKRQERLRILNKYFGIFKNNVQESLEHRGSVIDDPAIDPSYLKANW